MMVCRPTSYTYMLFTPALLPKAPVLQGMTLAMTFDQSLPAGWPDLHHSLNTALHKTPTALDPQNQQRCYLSTSQTSTVAMLS